jgi:drug/metabolite transporter (DMT)-like permease
MDWQIAIFLQTILVALSFICLRVLTRNKRYAGASFAVNAGLFVSQYVVMLALVPLFGHVNAAVVAEYWWRFMLGGLAFVLTNVCAYKTLVYFDVAIANIVATVNAIFAVIGAIVFLSENLSLQQVLGAIVLLLAIAYGLLATHATHKKSVRRSVWLGTMYAVLGGLCFAFAAVNEKSLLGRMSIGSYLVCGVGGQCLMAVLAAIALQPQNLKLLLKSHVATWSVLSGVFRGLGGTCFIVAEVKSNNVGLVSVLANFRLMIVILLGAWLLREHNHLRQKVAAATASIAGIAIMFWK